MRRTRPRSLPHPLSFSTLLSLFLLYSPCFVLAHLPVPRPKLLAREEEEIFEFPNEHVILADCTQGDRHLSSQMAYYNDTPSDKPLDIAIVDTNPGYYALWINSNTTGLFTDTSFTFTATLGPKVSPGKWAGFGQNFVNGKLVHNFNCWSDYLFEAYYWEDARCSQVYKCNHEPKPANAPDITITSNPTPDATGTADPTVSVSPPGGSNGTVPATDQSSSNGLSHGALIGAIVGSVGVLVIGGLVGLWILLRRRSRNKDKKDLDSRGDVHEADDGAGVGGFEDKKSPVHPDGTQELDAKLQRFEMDTEAHRFEMDNNEVAELDGTEVGYDRKDPSDIKLYDLKLDMEHDQQDTKGGYFKYHHDTKGSDDVKRQNVGDTGDNDAIFDEPKTMIGDEMKARAIDKAVIRASTGAGSATVSRWTDKKDKEQGTTEEQHTGDEAPLRPPPTRSETTWTNWTSDSDVDLAGFPLVLMKPVSPISPLSPSEPKPPNG